MDLIIEYSAQVGNLLFCYRSVEELKCHLYVKHKRDEKECPFFSCKYFCSNPYTFKVFFFTLVFLFCVPLLFVEDIFPISGFMDPFGVNR